MIIHLIPVFSKQLLTVKKSGDTLTVNDQVLDFSPVPDGATLPKEAIGCEHIVDDVHRIDGVLLIKILFPHSVDASEAARFPEPIIDPADGILELPQ